MFHYPKRKLTRSGLKRKLDKLVSEITRSRGYCIKCGKSDNLQAAHIFSRNMLSVRWDLDNVLCLCAGCHFEAHAKPIFFAEFVKGYLESYKYTQLKLKARMIVKWSVADLQTLYAKLKEVEG